MKTNTIKTLNIFLSLTIFTYQTVISASRQEDKPNHSARAYYKPVTVIESSNKDAKSIGIYQRAQIGNDGAYGTFTRKHTTTSQTVLEHNPTTTPIAGITDKKVVGYILNTNPGAGSLAGAPSYLELYLYTPAINLQKKTVKNRPSMPMKKAQYIQAK